MIRSPLGLRLDPARPIRDQIRAAAEWGAKGIVVDAVGDLAPDRLSETGRRDFRHLLRTAELTLVALGLPTRRPFDTVDQLDDRLRRAETACVLAFELGTNLVLARVGGVPPESDAPRRDVWTIALTELGRRADHHGIRLALETGAEPGEALRLMLDALNVVGLAASIDPASLLAQGHDPVTTTRALGSWVAHAYANDATTARPTLFAPNPRGLGFAPGTLDWEEYLGSLEEIDYRGFLTIWPDPNRDPGPQFQGVVDRLKGF